MRIGIITFTYRGDEVIMRKVLENHGLLRAKYPQHEIHSFVFDDAGCPFEKPICGTDKVHYFQTGYNRNGNLNGIENIKGQIACMKTVQDAYSFDYLIKADSDTCLLNLEVLSKGYDYCGTSDAKSFYGWGAAYFLSRKGLNAVFALAGRENTFLPLQKAIEERRLSDGEDVLMGNLVYCVKDGLNVCIKGFGEDGALIPSHLFETIQGGGVRRGMQNRQTLQGHKIR